jgi:hypothetical protein
MSFSYAVVSTTLACRLEMPCHTLPVAPPELFSVEIVRGRRKREGGKGRRWRLWWWWQFAVDVLVVVAMR